MSWTREVDRVLQMLEKACGNAPGVRDFLGSSRSSTVRAGLQYVSDTGRNRSHAAGVVIPLPRPGLVVEFDGIIADPSVDGRILDGSASAGVLESILFDWWETSRPSLPAASPERSGFFAQG